MIKARTQRHKNNKGHKVINEKILIIIY